MTVYRHLLIVYCSGSGHEGGAELQKQNYTLCRSKAAGSC